MLFQTQAVCLFLVFAELWFLLSLGSWGWRHLGVLARPPGGWESLCTEEVPLAEVTALGTSGVHGLLETDVPNSKAATSSE